MSVWWNYGPDNNYLNNWKWINGSQIWGGAPYANLKTLRFPDINGDGRADIVVVGLGGSVKHWLNMGRVGADDPVFHEQGGIATGAVGDISRLVFADVILPSISSVPRTMLADALLSRLTETGVTVLALPSPLLVLFGSC